MEVTPAGSFTKTHESRLYGKYFLMAQLVRVRHLDNRYF